MTDSVPADKVVASIVRLGTQRLLVVDLENQPEGENLLLSFALRPAPPGGGGEDDWCIGQGATCGNLGPHCGSMSIPIPLSA